MFKCFKLGQAQFKDSNFHCYSPVQFTPAMVFFGVTVHDCAVCRVGQLVDSSTSELLERIESFLDFDSLRGSQAEQYWHSILGAVFPELQELSLKNRLAALIQCGKRNMAASKFTFVEYFSGCGNLTKSFLAQEHLGAAFDFKYTSNHDCLTVEGLRLWFAALLSCGPKSFIWFAIECSSWVPLCLSQSLRHESNGYLGDTSKVFVQNGNAQMVVSSLLMFVACLLGHIVSLEQPLGSMLPLCDLMDTVLKIIGVSKTVCYLGAYGAKSVKPVQLWSTSSGLVALETGKPSCPEELAQRGNDGQYTGKKDLLAESEQYPILFCSLLADLFVCGRL